MALDLEGAKKFTKEHWALIVGGIVGLFVLYYLVEHLAASPASTSAASGTSLAGNTSNVDALGASADLANAQTNAAIETSQINGAVEDNQIAASLQSTAITTAAQLNAENAKTASDTAIALAGYSSADAIAKINAGVAVTTNGQDVQGAVDTQSLKTNQAIKTAQIEGSTLQNLADTSAATTLAVTESNNAVKQSEITDVNSQIGTLLQSSKHFGSDIQAIAPVFAIETGQGNDAGSLAASNAQTATAKAGATASEVKTGGSLLSSVLGGLF